MEPLRAGIIGVGDRARALVRAAERSGAVHVAAFCSQDQELARWLLPGAKPFDRPQSLFDSGEVDAVIIAVPNHLHAELARAALDRDLHVLCEKPLGISRGQVRAVLAAARRSRGILHVGTELRWAPMVHDIGRAIGSASSPLRLLWAQEFRGPFRPGADGWRLDPARSGGAFLEKNIHHFDLFALWAGARPVRVHAVAGDQQGHGQPDHGWVSVEFGNGVLASLGLSLLQDHARLRLGALGPGWSVEYDSRGEIVEECRNGTMTRTAYDVDTRGLDVGEFDHPGEVEQMAAFAARARGACGEEQVSPPYWAHVIAFAARESAATGRPVDLNDDLADEEKP